MTREELTAPQIDVVEASERTVLVLGAPGSGKTTTALWAARAELERESSPSWSRVLFLTFSRSAVRQLASRAPGVFGGRPDRIEVSTFHGFAYRLLVAFGRYCGHGLAEPEIQSEAQAKLFGKATGMLTYSDLVPRAAEIFRSRRFATLLARRWPLVICDEFQDTSDDQWALICTLGKSARLLLLADPDQMIYTFVEGVGPARLEEGRRLAQRVIDLGDKSHRDRSGLIVAMARSVRDRRIEAQDVRTCVDAGQLRVRAAVGDEELVDVLVSEIGDMRAAGLASIGVFAHSNEGVATLSAALAQARLDHILVGIPESHGEALQAMAKLCAFGAGLVSREESRATLATFLTACTRGKRPPQVALALIGQESLDPQLERRLLTVERALVGASDLSAEDTVTLAARAWPHLGITGGSARPWRRAAPIFLAIARPMSAEGMSKDVAARLLTLVERRRRRTLTELETADRAPVQLMNFHQTKSREADGVILVYRDRDYLAGRWAAEPFTDASKVLFVSLTRSRQRVVVILPNDPHPLVAPFASLAI